MPKIKVPKKSPSLDMTPMVDLAFLLVTFFMLTTKFRPDEPVIVDQPSSISETLLPDTAVMVITVDDKDRVFFNMEGKFAKQKMITKLAERFELNLNDDEKKRFSVLASIGVPSSQLKQYLSAEDEERKKMNVASKGIPYDSLNNELATWLYSARMSAPYYRLAIKGDKNASVPAIKQIISTVQDNKLNTFALITNLEDSPR